MKRNFAFLALSLGISLPAILISLGLPSSSVEAAGNPFGPNRGQRGWIAEVQKTNLGGGHFEIEIPAFNVENAFSNGKMPIGEGLSLSIKQPSSANFGNSSRTTLFPVDVQDSNGKDIGDGLCETDMGRTDGDREPQGTCRASGQIEK